MTTPLAGRRVLVADDERAVAAAVVRRMERDGALCRVAHSGAEALQHLADAAFDLVLAAVRMPGRSGLDLLAELQRVADPPVVLLMGARDDGAVAADALARGADGWVAKPVDADLLMHEVARALELHALRRAAEASRVARDAGPVLVVLGEIVSAFEKADPYRAGFSARTARLAVALAQPLGLDAERLALAARIHDVGMLAVPVTEQHADGPLERTSQHLIRVHPTLGARWVERLGADRAIVAAIAAHHERHDGQGYPGGIGGEEIPPLARALGTAAAVAAMSLPRPWRPAMDAEAIAAELVAGRGTQFGPEQADAAAALIRRTPHLVA
jgi:putative two-component system response regulator